MTPEEPSAKDRYCDICTLPLIGEFIGNGDGFGQRFAHPECWYRKSYHQDKETTRKWERANEELETRLRAYDRFVGEKDATIKALVEAAERTRDVLHNFLSDGRETRYESPEIDALNKALAKAKEGV